jgi:hypothetical protein
MEPGKDNCPVCAGLIRLCAGLDFFPADLEVRWLLVRRLHGLAKDHQHAKAMISRWLETEVLAPKIANLVSLAAQVRIGPALPAGCDICGGQPFVVNEFGAGRCTCARGQALRQLDRAREAQRAARKEPSAFMHAIAMPDGCGSVKGP